MEWVAPELAVGVAGLAATVPAGRLAAAWGCLQASAGGGVEFNAQPLTRANKSRSVPGCQVFKASAVGVSCLGCG
jgi:hypothetical protein